MAPDREEIANELRRLYELNPENAEGLLESYLERVTGQFDDKERIKYLESIKGLFLKGARGDKGPSTSAVPFESIFRGKDISMSQLAPDEYKRRLKESLDSLFEGINEIMLVIDTTLLGKGHETETIRHVLGSSLTDKHVSIEEYLKKIKLAFWVCHKAFQKAAYNMVEGILSEIRPENIEKELGQGLRFGPLKKAEFYDLFKEKYHDIQGWVESGRFHKELLREFERQCQKMFSEKERYDNDI